MARIDFRSVGGSATLSYASNSNDVGTTSAAGASTLVSRADHVHAGATLSYASNSTQVADANAAGASTLVSRADHRHMGVAAITSSSSNTMTDPTVNLRAGDNIGFALNVATNTLTISGAAGGTGTSISYASNSNAVGTANAAGASALVSRADHVHAGYSIITSSSSNTLSPSTLNLRAGTGIAFGLDTSSTNSTLTISNIGGGGGGGGVAGAYTIVAVFDGGGAAITGNPEVDVVCPSAGTLTGWTILADVSGSAVVDVWKDTYANYPPTVADTIAASAKPTLSSVTKNQDVTLTGWTKTLTAGDIIRFHVDSASTVTRVTVVLTYVRS